MGRRIAFINPFGTAVYDEIVAQTLTPYALSDTDLTISHLSGVPKNIDFYYPRHLIELVVCKAARKLEKQGFDAIIVGCCSDPGVKIARELVDLPVVGPLEAAVNHASYFGHHYSVVTDSRKAVSRVADLVRFYGGTNCRGVHCIDQWVSGMLKDTAGAVASAAEVCEHALAMDGSEVAILGCTIIGACLEQEQQRTGLYADLPILNPNLLALKAAETLADLYRHGKYRLSRRGMFQRHEQHDPAEAAEVQSRYRLVDTWEPHAEEGGS